jgi:hypothetical protein
VIDVEFAHELLPVHVGIEQSRNNEFAAEIEHLRTRRRGGVGGKQITNDIALDQQRAIEPRKIGCVLTFCAQRLRYILQRHDRSHAVIDVEFAHELLPVHVGIEQSRNNEFAAEIEHLRTRRRGGVGGKQITNDIALDQQRAILKGRVRKSVDDRRPSDETRRRRLSSRTFLVKS